jgi:putative redox protein
MVSFHITYAGDLRCEVTHDPSKVTLVTDAPTDNQGRGESFSPTDLVCTGLGVCILTTMGIAHHKDPLPLNGARAYVETHMSTDAPRRIARIVVRIEFGRGIPVHRRASLERIASTCPVARSLHPDIIQEVSFIYPD